MKEFVVWAVIGIIAVFIGRDMVRVEARCTELEHRVELLERREHR